MPHSKVTIHLNPNDARALVALAKVEYREPHAQAAILIREALVSRGFLQFLNIQPRIENNQENSIQYGK